MTKINNEFQLKQLFSLNYLYTRLKNVRTLDDLLKRVVNLFVLFAKILTFKYGKKYWQQQELIKNKTMYVFKYIEQGKACFSSGRFKEAEEEYLKAINVDEKSEEAHFELGKVYYKQDKLKEAEKEFKETVNINKQNKHAYFNLVSIYKRLKKYDECIKAGNEFVIKEHQDDREYNEELLNTYKAGNKDKQEPENLQVKIIRTPYFDNKPGRELDYCLLLPIGMARIVSYLRSNGIAIDQDDLNIRINHDNKFGAEAEKIDRDIFFDENRIIKYSKGKEDKYIDSVLEKVEGKTEFKDFKVVLFSVFSMLDNTSGYMFTLALARYLKKRYNPVIIIGGQSSCIEDMLKYDLKDIDHVIEREGEKILFKVLSALNYKVDIKKVPDISAGNDGKLIQNNGQNVFDIVPDYNGLPVNLYEYKGIQKITVADAELKNVINELNKSRIIVSPAVFMEGCSHSCVFCADSAPKPLLALSPVRAVEYLKQIKEKQGIKYFFFLHNTINLSKKYINELCDEMIRKKLDILWCDCARADNLDRETLIKMRKAGCIRLVYGLETASPRLLKYIDKEINLTRLENILSWTCEAGMCTGIEMICGFPHETKEDLDMNIEFLNRNRRTIDRIYYNVFYLTYGSRLHSDPALYKIENLSRTDTFGYGRKELKGLTRISFDEKGALKWEDKLKQMTDGFDRVVKETTVQEKIVCPCYELEHILFYLYSKYNKKEKVLEIFNKICKTYE